MREFLKKYLTEEQLTGLEQAYLADHPDAKGLPTYISKGRLDEVIGQKKALEDAVKQAESIRAELQGKYDQQQSSIEAQVAEAVKAAKEEAAKGFEVTEAIYKAHGRNTTAIKALMDPTKGAAEEIARLQKSDPYLFEDDIPAGTGRGGIGGVDEAANAELAKMRAAVGILR